jgi:hypothetical protein
MRIRKIANQTMSVPPGCVKVRVRIDKQGNFKREIIREGQTICESGDDKKLLDDLLNLQIPGYFGKFGTVTERGKTAEAYEQSRPKVAPIADTPEEEEEFGTTSPQTPQKKLDQGYGV